jgi:alpha-galactosidase
MPKIVFLGAGSTVFALNLLNDILNYPALEDSVISLHDIDKERLGATEKISHQMAQSLGVHPVIETYIDRRRALKGADYAIGMFQIGGYRPATIRDFEIPKRFGLRQTIADTLGIGGIMRGLRTIPVYLEMCRDMVELCPDVFLLNYVNPMAMVTWAINQATPISTVGLCHSVQGTASYLAGLLGLPADEINFICAGINHMAFYLRFEHHGKDLYPKLRELIQEGRVPDHDRVRFDILKRLGYFVTESSEHLSEYTPWFIKKNQPDLIEKYNIPLDEYLRRCEVQIAGWEVMQGKIQNPDHPIDQGAMAERLAAAGATGDEILFAAQLLGGIGHQAPSNEYGAQIINAMETGEPCVIYGNVANEGLIQNLPNDCCVEVPCLVDKSGLQPTKIGTIPPQLAALMQTNINVQTLTVEAALTQKRDYIYQAAMLDPHTGAELDLDQIWDMVDAMIEAHGDWLPHYR